MKKIICLWISIVLLASCLTALAEESPWQYDDMNMVLERTGEVSGDVEIPAEVNGYAVKALDFNMFSGQDAITSIKMPDSVEALRSNVISNMGDLTSVQLSQNLVAIESDNFDHCQNLTSLTLPASVSYIEGSIRACDNLREIRFTGACPVFVNADSCLEMLPEDCVIYVPDDQLEAYKAAVGNKNGAADKMQPSGTNAVTVDFTVPESDFNFDAATGTIAAYTGNAARVDIPAAIGGTAVKSIGTAALATYAIRYVVLPEGLETIGEGAFKQASNLCYAKFPSTLRTIGTEAFYNAQAHVIEWSEGLEEIGARAFMYDYERTLTLPSTVKTIGESAFERGHISELYLGNQLTSIGARAFAGTRISYMAFDLYAPIEIAADAFADTKVADLDLPWDSTEENRQAYEALLLGQCPDCTVWINNPIAGGVANYPENKSEITTVENGIWTAYHGDDENLTIWTVYDDINVSALGDGLFKGNQSIRKFYPHHCGWFTTIGAEAFADSSVEYVDLFGSITSIGREAFRNCANISELTLPASLTEIGENAFAGCTGLKKLTVLCDPSILPGGAFADSTALTEVYAAADATNEQVRTLSAAANRPWYLPAARLGQAMRELQVMPYEPLPAADFQYYDDPPMLDRYDGYEVNLVLPREIDGVTLTMVNGNVMTRAAYSDDYEMELPVRSVVVPETYRELRDFGFANCETLETVVFYAPIETLPDGFFSGCTNLHNVIFVNGVRFIGRNVFMNCPNLETVYLGECVESIDEYAFTNEDGTTVYSPEQCIQSTDAMPDVDALLAAVKSDPIPAPEPTEEPVAAVAAPIGPEGEAYFGTWYGISMDMDGETYNLAEMGLSMQLTFNADGTVELLAGDGPDSAVWTVENGVAKVETSTLTLTENGELCMDQDGAKIIFAREATSFTPEPVGEAGAAFVGTWYGITMEADGVSYNMADIGVEMHITLNADGTAEMAKDGDTQTMVWHCADGIASVGSSELHLAEDGSLYVEEGGSKVTFSQTPAATDTPAENGGEVEAQASEAPASGEAPAAAIDVNERMETKFVMESAEVQGMHMTADMLGGYEYSLVFHADGTANFVMAGSPVPALPWTQGVVATETGEADALIIDYYGQPLNVVITDAGFDMNYFDSMLIHFIAEQ